jgi:chemotaxis-related protein WspB
MLFLLFQLGRDRYALDARDVAEVLPLVKLKQVPQAPAGVAGIFDYRGAPVPVIDLCALALGRPAAARLSTRIVLVNYAAAGSGPRLLGLIAEQATEMLRRAETDFAPAGIQHEGAPYLGPVSADPRGLIQRVEVDRLLTPAVRTALFAEGKRAR